MSVPTQREFRENQKRAAAKIRKRLSGPCEVCRRKPAECCAVLVADGPLVATCSPCYWANQNKPVPDKPEQELVTAGVFVDLPENPSGAQIGDRVIVYAGKHYGRAHRVMSMPWPGYLEAEHGPTGERVTVHHSDTERIKD